MIVTTPEAEIALMLGDSKERTFTYCELDPPGEHFILTFKAPTPAGVLFRTLLIDSSIALLSLTDDASLPADMMVEAYRLDSRPETNQTALREVAAIFRDTQIPVRTESLFCRRARGDIWHLIIRNMAMHLR